MTRSLDGTAIASLGVVRALPPLVALLAAACGGAGLRAEAPPGPAAAATRAPSSSEVLAEADRRGLEGAPPGELHALLGLVDEALLAEPTSADLLLRQSRLLFLLAEPEAEAARALPWIERGDESARLLRRAAPDRVEGHYYGALFLGLRARHQSIRAAFFLDRIERQGRRALEIDRSYDHGGPCRLMGMLLLRAPSWPQGIGDPEEGLELLREAAAASDYPRNRLLLAEALAEAGERREACEQLAGVLEDPDPGRWGPAAARFRDEAETAATEGRCGEALPAGSTAASTLWP